MTKHILPFLVLLCACSGSPEANTEDQSALDEEIARVESGLLPNIIIEGDSIEDFTIADRMRHYNVPGFSIAVFEDGKIKWAKGYGYLSFDSVAKVDKNTRFQAASISKPVAATGLLTLVQEGELDLDENVNEYMSDWQVEENTFTAAEKVTLRRLVTHNAGLTVHGFRGYAEGEEVPTTVQVLNGDGPANSDPIVPDTLPGAIWRYSGGGYTVMQHVIEEKTQGSFPAYMQASVLDPLKMTRSTYEQPLPENMRDNVAIGHRGGGNKVEGNWHTYPEIAAAGLWTTPSDLARWAIAIQNSFNGEEGGVLSPETASAMLTAHMGDWGLGPGVSGTGEAMYFSHGGANEGYRCYLMAFATGARQGVAIMTNGDQGSALGNEVLRSVASEFDWDMYKPQVKSTISLTEEELQAYEGNYTDGSDLNVEFSMSENGGLLALLNGDREIRFLPEGPDQFFDAGDGTGLTFTRNTENEVVGFEVQGLTFVRAE